MHRPKPKRRWFQFRLSTLFVLTTLVACLSSGVVWWRSIREQRALQRAVRECDSMPEEAKELLCSLIWQDDAQELLERLGMYQSIRSDLQGALCIYGPFSLMEFEWHASFRDPKNRPRRVFLFYLVPTRGNRGMLVLTDSKHRLIQWKGVHVGGRFRSASLQTSNGTAEISIIADTSGLHSSEKSHGTYRFLLDDSGITECEVEWDTSHLEEFLSSFSKQDAE